MRPSLLPPAPPQRGFTLVELTIVCALAGILVAVSWPSLRPAMARASRADAVHALTRIQQAQARHHALHGLYAHDLRALGIVASGRSAQGLYAIALDTVHGDGYTASASALPGSPQAEDRSCLRLTVEVRRGFATLGPSTRCWQP
jgi:type IV pilus assembly protein PilE